MIKKMFLALAVLAPMAAAEPAMALKTSKTYTVRFDGSIAGKWQLRNKVVETATACRYTVQWSSLPGPPLGRTTLCKIDELRAGDNFDCEESRKGFFDTLVLKAPGTCGGFDDFGQQTRLTTLMAGENSSGELNGVVASSSVGDVQNLQVK